MADDKKADETVASTETAPKAAAKKAPAKKAPAKEVSTEAAATEKPKAARKPAAAKAAEKPSGKTTEGAGGTLRVHHLRPAPGAKTAKTRVGRGEASKGKTAGRGTKGTKARYQVPDRFEGGQMPLHMRLPKLRGFKNPFRVEYQVVNLDKLSALYPQGGDVTVADLVAKGAVRKGQPVKVLGTGDITVKVSVAVDAYSASAKEKIVAAGGSIQD
ncbi:50S ribosomal protein L15 [Cellulomonas sp. SLBN-39]|uniref:50S ribosomal protein L15 n=1 Tax=Cellulomonas sp. SLBN-39 TaxID=2768446 RepID=UPI00114E4085|nr:50S ribosomal protein L15 [Cellulomonas sp. SLBN-39]TQL03384.1 LSU ribosomal protein L15P [Cellulomonas sp. SLBN-39]